MKPNNILGIVFANDGDDRIKQLTDIRAIGAVPFAGRYRMIDFALSAMTNSGIDKVAVLTENNYHSLMDHIGSGKSWDLARKRGGLFILPPYLQNGQGAYKGKIDALSCAIPFLQNCTEEYVLLADADVAFNFPLDLLVDYHMKNNSDITIAYKKGANSPVTFTLNEDTICDIAFDKPTNVSSISSLDIILIKKDLLISLVRQATVHNYSNFMVDIIARNLDSLKVKAYEATGFVGTVGSMQEYFATNMRLLDREARDQLFSVNSIYTKLRDEMPARYGLGSTVENSLVAEGCIIEGEVKNSILFRGVKVGKGAVVNNSILMQSTVVGDNTTLAYVISDKNVNISEGRTLMGYDSFPVYIPKGGRV